MKFSQLITEADDKDREIQSVKFGSKRFEVGEIVKIKRAPGDDFREYKVKNIEIDENDEDTSRSAGKAYRITTVPADSENDDEQYIIDNKELKVITVKNKT